VYKLEKLNVVKVVTTEQEREKLLSKGFKEVVDEQEKTNSQKKDEKKAAK